MSLDQLFLMLENFRMSWRTSVIILTSHEVGNFANNLSTSILSLFASIPVVLNASTVCVNHASGTFKSMGFSWDADAALWILTSPIAHNHHEKESAWRDSISTRILKILSLLGEKVNEKLMKYGPGPIEEYLTWADSDRWIPEKNIGSLKCCAVIEIVRSTTKFRSKTCV